MLNGCVASRPYFFEHDVELMARGLLARPSRANIRQTAVLYAEAIELFPSSVFLMLSYAFFLDVYKRDPYRAIAVLKAAQRIPCSIGEFVQPHVHHCVKFVPRSAVQHILQAQGHRQSQAEPRPRGLGDGHGRDDPIQEELLGSKKSSHAGCETDHPILVNTAVTKANDS